MTGKTGLSFFIGKARAYSLRALYFFAFFASTVNAGDLLSVRFVNAEVGFISGRQGCLSKTTDGGLSWEYITTGVEYDMWDICPLGENILVAACSGGRILKTTDGGTVWETKLEGAPGSFKNIFLTYDNRLIACGENSSLYISYDHAETWESLTVPVSSNLNKIFFLDSHRGYIAGSNGTLLATVDGGETWGLKLAGYSRTNFTSVSMADDKIGTITGDNGAIINTVNNWQTWKAYEAPSGGQNICEVRYINGTEAVASGENFILKTTNNGRHWTFAQLPHIGSRGLLNSIHFISATKGIIVGSNGLILITNDRGETWNFIESPETGSVNFSQNEEQEGTDGMLISQNYPNPFNPSTTISYHIAKDSHVRIRVYDISGKETASLVKGNKTAGTHTAVFDASSLPSGVYFYTIIANNGINEQAKTVKMLLIK